MAAAFSVLPPFHYAPGARAIAAEYLPFREGF
jgi:hypothetical protein